MYRALQTLRAIELDGDWVGSLAFVLETPLLSAYVHANGFRKILLRTYDDGSRLRLHLWSHNCRANIHDHRWGFTSLVLAGAIQEVLYVDAGPEGVDYEVYTHTKLGIKRSGNVRALVPKQHSLYRVGDVYRREAGTVHAALATVPFTASLVATDPPLEATEALVFAPVDSKPVQLKEEPRQLSSCSVLAELRDYCAYEGWDFGR